MNVKLGAFGLGLIAALAISAMGVVNATAETGGHFVSSVSTGTTIVGSESGTHTLHFTSEGGEAGQRTGCDNDAYTGSVVTGTSPAPRASRESSSHIRTAGLSSLRRP